jgi:hypothetical protein
MSMHVFSTASGLTGFTELASAMELFLNGGVLHAVPQNTLGGIQLLDAPATGKMERISGLMDILNSLSTIGASRKDISLREGRGRSVD